MRCGPLRIPKAPHRTAELLGTVAGRPTAGKEGTNHERAGDARDKDRARRPFSDPLAHIRVPVPRDPSASFVTAEYALFVVYKW